jgi:endonuclease YncB( thermonuclease family)
LIFRGEYIRLTYAFLFCVVAAHPLLASEVSAVPRIVDGDTIYAGTVKIRLRGVDAPETDQLCLDAHGQSWTCGIEAKIRLQAFSRDRTWVCQLAGTDRYGRYLGSCSIDGVRRVQAPRPAS